MKTTVLVVVAILLASSLHAQEAKHTTYADKQHIEAFFKSKTMVVMDANPLTGYNFVIGDAIKKFWTITPYEIISSERFDELRTDPSLSFIFLSKLQLEKDDDDIFYLYMNIVMGAKVSDITELPELLSLPLAYTGVDEDSYVDKLPLMLRFTQLHLNNLKEAKNPKWAYQLKNHYGKDSKLLKDKILLVKENDLSEQVNTLDKIRKEYPGAVRIVTAEEMVKAIEEQAENTAILHQIGPGEDDNNGRSYCEIFGTDDARLYYYNHQNITQRRPAGMLARDFKLIIGK